MVQVMALRQQPERPLRHLGINDRQTLGRGDQTKIAVGAYEGVEGPDEATGWLLGVQWHPEDDVEAGLFEGFARAVQRAATGSAAVGLP